jgi:hypothetical protein
VKRLTDKYPHLVPVHGPIHASWLNQIEAEPLLGGDEYWAATPLSLELTVRLEGQP